jgi:serine phosphatase RsbU (regulator of sigma subunit)
MTLPYRILPASIFLMLFVEINGQSSTSAIDSLMQEMHHAKTDSAKSRLLYAVGDQYYNINLDSCLHYANQSNQLAKKKGTKLTEAKAANLIGICMLNKSCLISALENFNKSYQIYQSLNDKSGEAKLLNNLGVIYSQLGEYTSAIDKYKRSYALNMELQNYALASSALFNISSNELEDGQVDLALQHAKDLQKLKMEHPEADEPADLYASIFLHKNMLDSASKYCEKSMEEYSRLGDIQFTANARLTMATIQMKQGNLNTAYQLMLSAQKDIDAHDLTEQKISLLKLKSEYFNATNQQHAAYSAQLEYINLKDSIAENNKLNTLIDLNLQYETERMEKELESQEMQLAENKIWFGSIAFIAISLFIAFISVFYFLGKNKKLNRVLSLQNDQINQQRQKIISSIKYAKKIQQSTLPHAADFKTLFKESFIYVKPKDIISGDFFAYQVVGNSTYVAAIDCTGHGVPGAFMSLIANTKLNRVINELGERDPGRILAAMHREIQKALQQETNDDNAMDGMEMSICMIDKEKQTIQFAGAGSSILLMQNNQLMEYKGTPLGIGGRCGMGKVNGYSPSFATIQIPYAENDTLFLYSDGFHDQIGGAENKKLNKTRFNAFVQNLSNLNLFTASDLTEKFLNNWRSNQPQTDDIMLIGIRL